MRIKCLHGYFIFEETAVGQIADFMQWSGFELVPKDNYYTFKFLENAPDYSIAGKMLLGYPATVTFEGQPWEVFEANGIVYNFELDLLLPINAIAQITTVKQASNLFFSPGLILPGSLTEEGERVRDYAAWFSKARLSFLYSDVGYV